MKAPPFAYLPAAFLGDAFRLRREAGPEARWLAGGQSLLATLAFRLSEPATLIDISRLGELKGVAHEAGRVRIGALTTIAELGRSELIATHAPLIAAAVPLVAHAAIRNRGTIGGSLAFADPAAELPACCVALDATVIAAGASGERRIPARGLFTGLYATALAPDELIVAVEVPVAQAGERTVILEIARRSGDYAMAGIAARARLAGDTLADPVFVFFGVGDRPVTASRAAAEIVGKAATHETVARAQAALDADLDPPEDQHGGPDMKRHLARVLLARAVARLAGTAGAGTP